MLRIAFYILSLLAVAGVVVASSAHPHVLYWLLLIVPFIALGLYDIFSPHNVLTNYPIIGHLRYMMEFISPEIRQYFLEDDESGRPFTRQQRDLIKARGRGEDGTHPFGTEHDVDRARYRFALHSIDVKNVVDGADRVTIGGPQCTHPYNSSRLNISAMSYGALSPQAIMAMNKGAKMGNFAQDTGEGGLSPFHLKFGADVIWEIGSGYFGCRTKDGKFNADHFREKARKTEVRMIEIKLSQGAKPGHGGLLPGAKVSEEIAKTRDVEAHKDCLSPAKHSQFNTPRGLLEFVAQLRELCGGKPVGFKLCVGRRSEFMGICKAIVETGIKPDFITIDGAEGGTGAAPIELSDSIGLMLDEALPFVHSVLTGLNLRQDIRLIASGKVVSGFDITHKLALGADVCNMARPMMFAVGCIQAMRCHTNTCPSGVATQDPRRAGAVDVDVRGEHVKRFHAQTIKSFLTVLGIVGCSHPNELTPGHMLRRGPDYIATPYDQIYPYCNPGDMLENRIPEPFKRDWELAAADHF
ncbi:MAG: FMN-binding glutamate synthase family protein [Rudaea sp.]